jgi:DNA-binding NtrC family response regulator
MNGLLIANNDQHVRAEMAEFFNVDGYRVTTADSVTDALEGILDKSIQVVLLSGSFDEKYVSKFIPLLKKCNRNLSIILVSDDMPLELLRLIRKEGIFYHALKPAEDESWEEILQAVRCAFENYKSQQQIGLRGVYKKLIFRGVKTVLTSLVL